jgi:hypothetical protein
MMSAAIWVLGAFCGVAMLAHLASIALAIARCRSRASAPRCPARAVTVVRPLCGLDDHAEATLASVFQLDHPHYEVVLCIARRDDPAVALAQSMIKRFPGTPARLLIGDERISANPKLNNIVKGWNVAAHDWVVLADSNVLMPPDCLSRLFDAWHIPYGQSTRSRTSAAATRRSSPRISRKKKGRSSRWPSDLGEQARGSKRLCLRETPVTLTHVVSAHGKLTYDKALTALLVIDPYNDFISEGGKVWDRLKDVAEANECVPHMLQVLNAARKAELRIFYALHRRYRAGDYETWKYIAPIQKESRVRKGLRRRNVGRGDPPRIRTATGRRRGPRALVL